MCMVREGCWELANATRLFPSQIGHNMKEIAHDCVMALKAWFQGKGIKNSFDTGHGKC